MISSNDGDEELLGQMESRILRKLRRFWIFMAIAAGLPLALLGFLIGSGSNSPVMFFLLSLVPVLPWSCFCAYKIMSTVKNYSFDQRMVAGFFLGIGLAALSTGLLIGVLWAGCYMIMGGRMHPGSP